MRSEVDETDIHIVHTIWSAALTALGGLALWSWKRLQDTVDSKADKSEVQELRADLRARWAQQDIMHSENRRRLDRILERVTKRDEDEDT